VPKTNSLIASKLEKVRTQLPYLPRALNLVWTAARGWTVAWITLLVIQGVLPVAIVTLTKVLVDSLVAAVDAGGAWDAVRGPLLLALIMAGLLLITELLRAPTRFVRTAGGRLASSVSVYRIRLGRDFPVDASGSLERLVDATNCSTRCHQILSISSIENPPPAIGFANWRQSSQMTDRHSDPGLTMKLPTGKISKDRFVFV